MDPVDFALRSYPIHNKSNKPCSYLVLAGNYGFSGMQEFSAMAHKAGICEATTDEVSNNADDDAYDQVYNIAQISEPPN